MGRPKIDEKKKKTTISITLEKECMDFIIEKNLISKSDFVNWLIREHFNKLDKK